MRRNRINANCHTAPHRICSPTAWSSTQTMPGRLVSALFLVVALAAFPNAAPVYDQVHGGNMQWLDMKLVKGHPNGGDLRVMVQIVGTTPMVVGFGSGTMVAREWHGVTLKYANGKLTGSQRITQETGKGAGLEYPMQLDVQVQGSTVQGTFVLDRSKAVSNRGEISASSQIKGNVTGTARQESHYKTTNAVSPNASWDSYVGSKQNWSGGTFGHKLVDRLEDARLLWVTPFVGGMQIGDCRHGCRMYGPWVGGGATPLLYKGKLLQFHHEPSGSKLQKCFEDGKTANTTNFIKNVGLSSSEGMRRFSVQADEMLSAFDAATGRLLWRTRWAKAGINLIGHKDGFNNNTGAAGDGMVFVFGTTGIVRALDLETGKEKWSKEIPGYSTKMKAMLERGLSTGELKQETRSYAHGLNYVDGVVIAPTSTGRGPMAGIDGKTGELLWQAGSLGSLATPLRWTHKDKEYLIAGDEDGKLVCIAPKSGQVLWNATNGGKNQHTMSLEGDYLLTGAGGFKLSLTGAQKLWDLGCSGELNTKPTGLAYEGKAWIRCNEKLLVKELASGKTLKSDPALSSPNESMTFAGEGHIFINREAQHNNSHDFQLFKTDIGNWKQLGTTWRPKHPIDLTYAIPVHYPMVEGRLYMRGSNGIYCYDLRKSSNPTSIAPRQPVPSAAQVLGPQVPAFLFENGTVDARGRALPNPGRSLPQSH